MKDFIRRLTMPQLGSPVEPVVSITGRRRLVKPQDGYPDPEIHRAYASLVSKSLDDELSRLFFPEWSGMFTTTCTSPNTEEMTFDIEAVYEAIRKVGIHPGHAARYGRPTTMSPTFRHAYGPSNYDWLTCPGHLTMRQARSPGKSVPILATTPQCRGEQFSRDYARYAEKTLRHVAESTSRPYSEFAEAMENAYRPYWLGVYYRYAEEVWFERLCKGRKGFTLPRGLKRRLKRIYANKVWDMLPSGVRVFRDKRNVDNLQAQFYADAFAAQLRSKSDFGVIHDELWRSV